MNEEKKREAKMIILSIAKLRDFCKSQDDCMQCPLNIKVTGESARTCHLIHGMPHSWDPDEALYRIAYEEGRKEHER